MLISVCAILYLTRHGLKETPRSRRAHLIGKVATVQAMDPPPVPGSDAPSEHALQGHDHVWRRPARRGTALVKAEKRTPRDRKAKIENLNETPKPKEVEYDWQGGGEQPRVWRPCKLLTLKESEKIRRKNLEQPDLVMKSRYVLTEKAPDDVEKLMKEGVLFGFARCEGPTRVT